MENNFQLGTDHGWDMPRIGTYHSGPYRVALILQDPGSQYTSGSGAQVTGELGVLNPDPTARFVKEAIEEAGFALSEVLPLNALPGYGLRPIVKNLREGAEFNAEILTLAKIEVVILGGAIARRFPPFGSWRILKVPHPSRRSRNMNKDAARLFKEAFLIAKELSA